MLIIVIENDMEDFSQFEDSLFSKKNITINYKPFVWFEIPNFLSPQNYEELLCTYPDASTLPHFAPNENKTYSSLEKDIGFFNEFFEKNPLWMRFVGFLKSNLFTDDLEKTLKPALFKARGFNGLKKWVVKDHSHKQNSFGFLENIRKIEVSRNINLTSIKSGGWIHPHSDAQRKLISMVFYLAPKDWRPEYGGGTRLFKAKNKMAEKRWCNNTLNTIPASEYDQFFENFDCFYEASFSPNKLVVFLKSQNSFHNVARVNCPPQNARNALVINYNLAK